MVIVEGCGNAAISLAVGGLVGLWSAQEQTWTESAAPKGNFPGKSVQREIVAAHERITTAIGEGNEATAARLVKAHLQAAQGFVLLVAGAARPRGFGAVAAPAAGLTAAASDYAALDEVGQLARGRPDQAAPDLGIVLADRRHPGRLLIRIEHCRERGGLQAGSEYGVGNIDHLAARLVQAVLVNYVPRRPHKRVRYLRLLEFSD